MKTRLTCLFVVYFALCAGGAESADTEIKVVVRTLDRQDKIARPKKNAEELTRGLRVNVKNTGTMPQAEGEIAWEILVKRPGNLKALLATGKEPLKALKAGEAATVDAGAVPVQEKGTNRQELEYRVAVNRGGKEEAMIESTPTFEAQADAARPEAGKKKGKGKK